MIYLPLKYQSSRGQNSTEDFMNCCHFLANDGYKKVSCLIRVLKLPKAFLTNAKRQFSKNVLFMINVLNVWLKVQLRRKLFELKMTLKHLLLLFSTHKIDVNHTHVLSMLSIEKRKCFLQNNSHFMPNVALDSVKHRE